jgi:hypothetical protein
MVQTSTIPEHTYLDRSPETLGSYRDCPGDEGGLSPVICPGAVSIGSFELSVRRPFGSSHGEETGVEVEGSGMLLNTACGK